MPPLHRIENTCDVICHLPLTLPLNIITKIFGPLNIPEDVQYESAGRLTVLNENGRFHTVDSPSEHAHVARMRFLEMLLAAGADLSTFLEDHKIAGYVSRLAQGHSHRGPWFVDLPWRLLPLLSKLRRKAGTLLNTEGKIVGFLQETGLLQGALGDHAPGGAILDADKLAGRTSMNQTLSALSATGLLTGATLAATVVGIGVNLVGFAQVLTRLKRVGLIADEARQEAIAARLVAEKVDLQMLTRNRANTLACLELAEEAWLRSDPVPIWRDLQLPLLQQLNYEQCLLGKADATSIFLDERFYFEEAVAAYESVLLLDAVRFQTLLLMSEERAALANAEKILAWHQTSVFELKPDEVARAASKRAAKQADSKEVDVRRNLLRKIMTFKEKVHEINRHMVGRIELIRYLLEKGISGRAYIEEARLRTDTPLLFLPVG
jgi:hypothetical protein